MSDIRVLVLGSSSSGNATVIEADEGALLVDAGFSCRELSRRMSRSGVDPRELVAIVLTHEHTDHVRGARVTARRFDLPVYATQGTLVAASPHLAGSTTRAVDSDGTIDIAPFSVRLLPVPHDALEPTAAHVSVTGRRVLVATDLGHVPGGLVEVGRNSDALVFESNHDVRMLAEGPYPAHLKHRIRGPRGHLSNEEAADGLRALVGQRTNGVLLGHLSQQNNTERLALETVLEGLCSSVGTDLDIRTTSPDRIEELTL